MFTLRPTPEGSSGLLRAAAPLAVHRGLRKVRRFRRAHACFNALVRRLGLPGTAGVCCVRHHLPPRQNRIPVARRSGAQWQFLLFVLRSFVQLFRKF